MIEQMGMLSALNIMLLALGCGLIVAVTAYFSVIRTSVNQLAVQEKNHQRLTQERQQAYITLHEKPLRDQPIAPLNALSILTACESSGIHRVVLTETEPISKSVFTLCQFDISGSTRFADALMLLPTLNNVGIKSFALVAIEDQKPYLGLKMEVIGFCDQQ